MMGSDFLGNVCELEQQLDTAKQSLVTLNDNIRRFAGRSGKEFRDKQYAEVKRGVEDHRERQVGHRVEKNKRRSSVFNRLTGSIPRLNDDEVVRPRITSRVIREMPTKEEIVEAQGTDSESRARNRRMFGSLLGTLHKFCQEESRLKQKEDKKAQIEKKLEEQELQERESLKKERDSLYLDRRRKQLEIRSLEIKMERLRDFKNWETSMLHTKNFIRTKTKPHIFFKPRIVYGRLEHLLIKGSAEVDKLINLRREETHKELRDMDNINDLDVYYQIDELGCHENQLPEDAKNELERTSSFVDESKGIFESKENKQRNESCEQTLSSSVTVVKHRKGESVATE